MVERLSDGGDENWRHPTTRNNYTSLDDSSDDGASISMNAATKERKTK